MLWLVLASSLLAVAMISYAAWSERRDNRLEALRDQQRKIRADAIRTNALLDQEAFRAARAMHDIAKRPRG